MDIFPAVCALLGFVLIGASDAKVVTLNLSSSVVRGRKNFYATCNGTCGQVNVTIVSGNPQLFLAEKVIPFLQWSGDKYSGSVGCTNCFQKVIDVILRNTSSFGLSILKAKSGDIVKVYGANLKDIEERNFPSKTVNIGTLTHQAEHTAKFTCKGPCKQVLAYATGSARYVHWFLTINHPPRGTGSGGVCGNCVCLRSLYSPKPDTCKFQSITSSSFYVMVRPFGTTDNIILTVEASNLDLGLDKSTKIPLKSTKIPLKSTKIPLKSTKIPLPSKLLNLTSSRVGERKNFYGTCIGPCSKVTVTVVSGNPRLFLAEEVLPFLQWSGGYGGGPGCTNCLNKVKLVSFTNSSSFGLSFLTTTKSDIVKVEAANLNDTEERIFPKKTVDIGDLGVWSRKFFTFTCNGDCEQVRVEATSSPEIPQWFVDPTHTFATWKCPDCVCQRTRAWFKNTCLYRSFASTNFTVKLVGVNQLSKYTKLMVEGSNLDV